MIKDFLSGLCKDALSSGLSFLNSIIGSWTTVIAIAAATFFIGIIGGWKINTWYHASDRIAEMERVAKLENELRAANLEIEKKQLASNQTKEDNIKKVIVYVPKIITKKDDDACTINRGFVQLFNDSIRGEVGSPSDSDARASGVALSTVAETIATNHLICRNNATQLKNLQEVIRNFQKNQK